MKSILKLLSLILIFSSIASAQTIPTPITPEIPLGPKMRVWAVQQAYSGDLTVSGEGLMGSTSYDIENLKDLATMEDLLRSFDIEGISLQYLNPDAYTITTAQVRDVNGQVLLRAEHWWKLEKTISNNGRHVSYAPPVWSKNLWFNLQDLRVPFDGESATAYLTNGAIVSLEVFDGKLTLPSMLSWSEGTVELVRGGQYLYLDISTGARVSNTRVVASSHGLGVDSFERLQNSGMSVGVTVYDYDNWVPVFETVPDFRGVFTINVSLWEQWKQPVGVWYKSGNSGWKYSSKFEKGDPMYMRVTVEGGKSLYFYFEWDPSAGKG